MSGGSRPDRVTAAEKERAMYAVRDYWCSQRDLAVLAGLTARRFQIAVQALVLDGHQIISGPDGNRTTDDPARLREAGERLVHRARELLARAAALGRTADRIEGERQHRPVQAALFPVDRPTVEA